MSKDLKKILVDLIESADKSLTTSDLSQAIDRSRSVTSLYLNELERDGLIEKTNTRPVYWLMHQDKGIAPLEKEADKELGLQGKSKETSQAFDQFIGAEASFSDQIEEIKAVLSYPPIGLPLLLHGNSGVGKSYLAHVIATYLKEEGLACSENLIVFNCADYANNPELLSSVLFGYVKGAFTGANMDKAGLIEKANNGILFLDEVHRLSMENQEKLFQFLDKGYFRRLGEENHLTHSRARLILATTEDPKKVLLPTFYRRIPLVVDLKDFHDRPRYERITLVSALFKKEAERIQKAIMIDESLLDKLVNQQYTGNIGTLSNEIKIVCAQALRQADPNDSLLKITLAERSDQVKWVDVNQTLVQSTQHIQVAKEDLERILTSTAMTDMRVAIHSFAHRFRELFSGEYLAVLYRKEIKAIKERFCRMLGAYPKDDLLFYELMLLWYVHPETAGLYDYLLGEIREYFPRAESLAYQLLPGKPSPYQLTCLMLVLAGEVDERIEYNALLVAHGESTATSIQSVANRMLHQYIFDAINVPLDSSPEDIIEEVKEWLIERDTEKGVIMIVDMGSLTQIYKALKPQINGELLVVNNLTTAYALEIGQLILNKEPFNNLIEHFKKNSSTDIQYFEGFDNQPNVIITSISGPEINASISQLLKKYIQTDIKLIEMDYTELVDILNRHHENQNYFSSTVAIITTTPMNVPGNIKVINLTEIMQHRQDFSYLEQFKSLVPIHSRLDLLNELIYFFSKEGLSDRLEFLNPDIIITQVENVINKFEMRFNYTLNSQIKYVLIMHTAVLVERTILGAEDYEVPLPLDQVYINDKMFYPNIKSILFELEQFYRIKISDWEIYVIYEIISSSEDDEGNSKE
ncbi:PRD domain-containing protein [Atopobacter sp. AH10]|uniref:sigma 54-interacting transcriptional regulator n=1 Tax=Atopobacter sp. AH10 TaxID=2315861 RepID=UPI000EF1A79C|nr:sigma 54-interacting transcriptional regulator [Atopobacter sp. AH10]RLK62902.1 PRD domain-containing protein [Atopobacter sp. AH10]